MKKKDKQVSYRYDTSTGKTGENGDDDGQRLENALQFVKGFKRLVRLRKYKEDNKNER
jgi:hypothetical protein